MAVSLRRAIGGRESVRTMVMTAEVSSRWVGCRVAGVGVAILKAFLSGGGLSEPSRGARARLPELRTATSIANSQQLHTPRLPPTPRGYSLRTFTDPSLHFKSSSDAQYQSCLAPQTDRERW